MTFKNTKKTQHYTIHFWFSFRSGSAGGLDGFTPQHLNDLACLSAGAAGDVLLKELMALVNLMLSGGVTDGIIEV